LVRQRALASSFLALLIVVVLLSGAAASQRRGTAGQRDLPPVSLTCPMHPDVVEAAPGSCPICRMRLVPVRLEAVWSCPVHAVVTSEEPGRCPICRRDLIQMTVALTWTCANRPDIDQIERGTCPDGSPMIAKRTLRPHGNHNPQHGGQFFMAPDNFHHLEGTFPRPRVFRLYLYDDYARPLPREQMRRLKARVVTNEHFDPSTRVTTEIAAFPLKLARSGVYLEARVDTSSLPAQMTAKLRLKNDAPEYRFDFTFTALSKDSTVDSRQVSVPTPQSPVPSRPVASPQSPVTGPQTVTAQSPSPEPEVTNSGPETPANAPTSSAFATPAAEMPETIGGILQQLKGYHQQIGEIVQRGDFGAIWVPAFQAKDLAVALESRVGELPGARRETAEPALKRLVQMAWLLDAFGDVGNRQQILEAYAAFGLAVTDVLLAFQP
jgi:hypothetical protein